jgi:hypothetical protein
MGNTGRTMNVNIVNAFKLFTEDECQRLSSNLPDPSTFESNYHVYSLQRGIDDSWFEVVTAAVKNNNRMKISISSLSNLDIHIHGSTSFYADSMNWSPNELEKKMRVFVPLLGHEGKEFSVSIGRIVETFTPQVGYGYSWPAWATLSSNKNSNLGLVNLDGTVIGKKLS